VNLRPMTGTAELPPEHPPGVVVADLTSFIRPRLPRGIPRAG